MKKLWTIVSAVMIHCVNYCNAVDPSQCIAPLGMENGAIKDTDITASSSYDNGNVGPQHGRVRTEINGGAWCPLNQATTEPKEWLQIDLRSMHMITATGTQGRFGNGQGVEFTEAYMIEYWRPKLSKWIRYTSNKGDEVLVGNINTYLEKKQELNPPIWANKIRFFPYSYHQRTVCLRVELYGCKWTDGIISYSMPQGDKRGFNWEFYDSIYDGQWDGNELKRGLGLLTDGKFGHDDFKLAFYDSSPAWIGWKNDSHLNKSIEVIFEFDKVREFSAVHIFCNNQFTKDVQVFASASIFFSIGGKIFKGEPIFYEYMEDKIFESSRNVTIKLHHRVGKTVKLQLQFAARWILISEITFDSVVAHGNFNVELELFTTTSSSKTPKNSDKNLQHKIEIPVPKSIINDSTFLTIIIIISFISILIIILITFIVINRIRNRKHLNSSNSCHIGFQTNTICHLKPESVLGLSEKGSTIEAYGVTEVDEYKNSHSTTKSSLRSTLPLPHPEFINLNDNNDYQEPYQAFKYAPYYSYSSVVMEMQDVITNKNNKKRLSPSDTYDYAVPETGLLPLLSVEKTLPISRTVGESSTSTFSYLSKMSSRNSPHFKKSNTINHEAVAALKNRLDRNVLADFPRHRLRMLSKLSEGSFGTVYVAEADGIPEYSSNIPLGKRLVALKFLTEYASEKEKSEFYRDVKILAALDDPNITRVLGICSQDEQLCVVMEYLEHGDLCQFLKTHIAEGSNSIKSLSVDCLLYMGAQIASGMRYLESLNFVHRDLATRNCLIGKAYHIKVCDFGTNNEVYTNDYYKVDGDIPLPIRWMAWETIFETKYTSKSDVWSFAVTLWEILTLCRWQPFDNFSDPRVLENLAHMRSNDEEFMFLPKPILVNKDIYDLMLECWKQRDDDRPSFREILLFLQGKNLGYAPT